MADGPLSDLLVRLTGRPGYGIELVSKVNGIPKGSRLAVSTNLLACLIAVCMRATRQIASLTGVYGLSFVFALIARDEAAEQLRFGGMLFAGFIVSAVVLGWLMFPFPF